MINFFLLAWDTSNLASCEAAKQLLLKTKEERGYWREALNAKGLIVCAQKPISKNPNIFHLNNNTGVILGRLFRKTALSDDDASVRNLSAEESERIVKSQGQTLTDNFWGSYVSILPAANTEMLIGRDCSGLQLCYMTWHDGVFIAFSNLDSLPFLAVLEKNINWDYLASIARSETGSFHETGLTSIRQLAAGEYARINLHSKKISKFRSWKPERFTDDPIEDSAIAQRMLHDRVLSVVKTQSQDFNNMSLMLSGGLDSSILLACLRKFHPAEAIHAVHLHSTENDVSEDHYAQSMADAYDVRMEVIQQEAETIDGFTSYTRPPWPIPVDRESSDDDEYKQRQREYKERNIDSVFKGQGGDQIFFKKPQLAPLYDYKKKHPLDPRYFEILLNTARLTEQSVWKLERTTRAQKQGAELPAMKSNIFLSKEITERKGEDALENHPWFQARDHFLFGKYHQLKSFTYFDQYAQRYTPSTPLVPSIPPFINQPLMELMLRIPTYILLTGGRNRGLARETFKAELTPEVYNRENKGFVTRWLLNIFLMNLDSIKEFLYNGILVGENFLDKHALDTYLTEDGLKTRVLPSEIHFAIRYERWARSII